MNIPDGLSPLGYKAAEAIRDFLREKDLTPSEEKVFYSPAEWLARGEEWGTGSLLIIVHDGGNHASAFNWAYQDYELIEELRLRLANVGVFVEQATSWFSCVYPDKQ